MKDYYRILQVDPLAEPEVIESAYRGLLRKYRRDADGSPEAAERVQELKEAYAVLRDPAQRAEYDQRRRGPQADQEAAVPAPDEELAAPTRDEGAEAIPEAAPIVGETAEATAEMADMGWAPEAAAPLEGAGGVGGAVLGPAQAAVAPRIAPITVAQVLLIALVAAALFTRFWRLDVPADKMFDEVYFPTTAQEILHGNAAAWEFFGHENTHPPLSKVIMAGGMGIFGENSFGWRFPGALAGVGSIIFIYLLGRRLFRNEWVGLIAGFLMTFEGLAFAQSR
ncbi:MAG: DnaJ domain-containing protein, partial [Chloroflexi bacterium]|nr:DnaJ domain-containing protein [Chloroflexota bacterium]